MSIAWVDIRRVIFFDIIKILQIESNSPVLPFPMKFDAMTKSLYHSVNITSSSVLITSCHVIFVVVGEVLDGQPISFKINE